MSTLIRACVCCTDTESSVLDLSSFSCFVASNLMYHNAIMYQYGTTFYPEVWGPQCGACFCSAGFAVLFLAK